MASQKEEKMLRSKSQVLYRYLPSAWIDFSFTGQHTSGDYIAYVDHWNSKPLTNAEANIQRILRMATDRARRFDVLACRTGEDGERGCVGFGDSPITLTGTNCDVFRPQTNGEDDRSGITASLSPLVFFCDSCKKVYLFKDYQEYRQHGSICRMHRDDGKRCGGKLTQLKRIYYCKCGWATAELPLKAQKHIEHLKMDYSSNYAFLYDNPQGKREHIEMVHTCPDCGNRCYPKPALSPGQYFAQCFSYIDLINRQTEEFLTKNSDGRYEAVAMWLRDISREQLQQSIAGAGQDLIAKYQDLYDKMMRVLHDEAKAEAVVRSKAERNGELVETFDAGKLRMEVQLPYDDVLLAAENLLEYELVSDPSGSLDLDYASQTAMELNMVDRPDRYAMLAQQFGFSDVRVKEDIPFVTCAYGYTREKPQYEPGIRLRSFSRDSYGNQHQNRTSIYADKFLTEGVLFTLDRHKVLDWLVMNHFVENTEIPQNMDDRTMRLWFVNHVRLGEILPFTPIPAERYPLTAAIYTLLHSISHELIRAVAELCGLERNSLSEYIFPNTPAILIYCQNTQGFTLGALKSTFESSFAEWLDGAARKAKRCVFDPICEDRYKACAGCLFLNEISCEHFNKDLDRTFLKGYLDPVTGKRVHGFWEDAIYGSNVS